MNQDLSIRIAAIKAECEEILRLSEKATAGPWTPERTFGDWSFPFQMIVKTPKEDPSVCGYGITLQYGGAISCMGPEDPRNNRSRSDAEFIAHSRNVSPAMARAMVATICWFEELGEHRSVAPLENLANQWEGK